MIQSVTAFCPGHLSGYFKPVPGPDPARTGSLGAGIVISEGVRVRASASPTPVVTVRQRGGDMSRGSPPLEYLMSRLGVSASLETSCRLPIGAGFGLSAAALLASARALNELFSLNMSLDACAAYAHEAEIVHRTGLGDVAACQGGGRVCRKGPGIHAKIIRDHDVSEPVAAVCFTPMPSPGVLGSPELIEKISRAFPGDCPKSVEQFFSHSRSFAEKSGLITAEVREALLHCDGMNVPASMTMLGNGVFAYGDDAEDVLRPFGEVYMLRAAGTGAGLVEVVK